MYQPQLVYKTIFVKCVLNTPRQGGNRFKVKCLGGGGLLHRIVLGDHHHTSGGMLIRDSTTMTFHCTNATPLNQGDMLPKSNLDYSPSLPQITFGGSLVVVGQRHFTALHNTDP